MNELLQQLLTLFYRLWRKRWAMVLAAYTVCLLGWFYIAAIPDSYEAKARIYLDTETVLGPLMGGLVVRPDTNKQIELMQKTLASRPNLEKVARLSGMHLDVVKEEDMSKVIEEMAKHIRITSEAQNLFWIAYESGDTRLNDHANKEMAARVVSNLLNVFVEQDIRDQGEDVSRAMGFLDDQIASLERRLQNAEQRRAQFMRDNLGFVSEKGSYADEMRNVQGQLDEVSAALSDAQSALGAVSGQIGRTKGAGSPSDPAALNELQELRNRVDGLNKEVDTLKLKGYTDAHPDVVAARSRLASVQADLKQKQAALGPFASSTGGGSMLYDQMAMRQVDLRAQVAQLANRRARIAATLARMEERAKKTPEVEAQFTALDRDYNILKKQYDELVQRRQTLQLTDQQTAKSDPIKYRVIDPPMASDVPSSPNRPLLLTLVLLGGIVAGIGTAFILSHMQTTFMTTRALKDVFRLPVLGSITMRLSEAEMRRRRTELILFGLAAGGLAGSFGLILLVDLIKTNVI